MLQNLDLTRLIVHEVTSSPEGMGRVPIASDSVLTLDLPGKRLICERLSAGIGNASHCVDVTVNADEAGSAFQKMASLIGSSEAEFVTKSTELASALTRSQNTGSIKDGLAVFLEGTGWDDATEQRWVCVIKADPDRGLVKNVRGGRISLNYVTDLIMGAQQRLLKIGFFVEEVRREASTNGLRQKEDFTIKVYDHLMSNSGRSSAAQYFYSTFLGCRLAENAAKQTRDFYELTKNFIDSMDGPQSDRVGYRGHLVSYLKSQTGTISSQDFADTYLPQTKRQGYLDSMSQVGFPVNSVTKDVTLVNTKLRKQSLRFSSSVMLFGTPDTIRQSVRVGRLEERDGEQWTNLQIRGVLDSQP